MANDINNSIVADYYNKVQILYTLVYSKGTDGIHYGFWEKSTKNTQESLVNTTKFVCKNLDLNENDVVLDAGCGVGGTSIYISKNYGPKVTGLTISDVQLKIAREKVLKSTLQDKLRFSKQDYTRTSFHDNTFTKIFGLESICYACDKADFIKEAYRLLKKDGKIVVADGFLARECLNNDEKKSYGRWLDGWAVPNLSTVKGFEDNLKKAGFKNIKYHDKFEDIKKSRDRIYRIGIFGFPLSWLLYHLRIIPKNMHLNTIACIEQKRVFSDENNIGTYGVFVAEK